MFQDLNQKKIANALRFLSIDAIQAAKSGHPGMPLGMADLAAVLWNKFLVHNPNNPEWVNRDRFVLSNGHGSVLLYALLHLSGYDLTITDLKNFRQLHSKTPGHPEYGFTPGVEATTGPLGQGLGMAVGMAIAEYLLRQKFNVGDFVIIDHYTYCFVGDGCLMEGISHEACSLAGTLKLNKLIVFWDNNKISIDGSIEDWFTEDVAQRFRAYDWNVIPHVDGHDPVKITAAITAAKSSSKPSLICCDTIIGYGSSMAGTSKVHGGAFNEVELLAIRKNLSWSYPEFFIPEEIYMQWRSSTVRGAELNAHWDQCFALYTNKYPDLSSEFTRRIDGVLSPQVNILIKQLMQDYVSFNHPIATRNITKIFLEKIIQATPELFGGSADLANSDFTLTKQSLEFKANEGKIFNYLHFGVREFGMFAILNGIALHKGFIPYGGTFLAFVDYARGAVRLSAMMKQKVIYVLTHDSIGVGEDGPTHQPIEHLAMLRATPNLSVWRPCDCLETIAAWQHALNNNITSCLILSRQPVQQIYFSGCRKDLAKGGYILYGSEQPQAIIIATGSEVGIAVKAAIELTAEGHAVRVVSMPNIGLFLYQAKNYQEKVLPKNILARVAIEAGSTMGWHRFVGLDGIVLGVDQFGLSAPFEQIYQEFNLNVGAVKQSVLTLIAKFS